MSIAPVSLVGCRQREGAEGLPEVLLIRPSLRRDDSGTVVETWDRRSYTEAGVPEFVKDQVAVLKHGVLQGLHLGRPNDQGRLVTVLAGSVFLAVVDVRLGSPTFLEWIGLDLSDADPMQVYVPPGFAHGVLVTGDEAIVLRKYTSIERTAMTITLRWDDPAIGIRWPIARPILSEIDRVAPPLADLPLTRFPNYDGGGPRLLLAEASW